MKKLAIGCGIVALVLCVGAGIGAYVIYSKAKSYLGNFEALASFQKFADSVENRTPFTPPRSGELTERTMKRFAAVQDAMRAKMGAKWDAMAAMQDDLMKREQAEHRQSTALEDFRNVTAMMKFIVDAMGAWAEALNQQHFSVDEYYWVRGQVYAAAGLNLTEIALRDAGQKMKEGESLVGPIRSARGPVPARNKAMVAPYLSKMGEWAKLAFFGL